MSFKNSVQAPAGSVIKVTLGHVTLLLESKYTNRLHTFTPIQLCQGHSLSTDSICGVHEGTFNI